MNVGLKDTGLLGVYTMESKYNYNGISLNMLSNDSVELHLWENRINRGWSIEKAVTTPKGRKKEFTYFIDGEPAAIIAEKNGISKQQFWARIKKGIDIYKACTMPMRKTKKQIEWEKHKND